MTLFSSLVTDLGFSPTSSTTASSVNAAGGAEGATGGVGVVGAGVMLGELKRRN